MNSGVLAHAISIQLLLSVSSDLINATIEKNGDFICFWDKIYKTKKDYIIKIHDKLITKLQKTYG